MLRETQTERIIKHLRENREITSLEAQQKYGIMRLASRICDIRRKGYGIVAESRMVRNRDGKAVRVAVYRLEE